MLKTKDLNIHSGFVSPHSGTVQLKTFYNYHFLYCTPKPSMWSHKCLTSGIITDPAFSLSCRTSSAY